MYVYAYSDIILVRTVIFLSAGYDRIGVAGGAGHADAPFQDEENPKNFGVGIVWGKKLNLGGTVCTVYQLYA